MRAVGNNFNSATNIFRIFNNALAFLIKPKQLQKIEKRKKERENLTWRSPGSPTGPALQLAGPAHHCSPSVVFLPSPRSSCVPGAQASRASSSLPAWLPPRRPGRLPRRHDTPDPLSLPPCRLLSPLLPSLSQPRARLSPPSTVSVATAHASPPRVVHRLCYLERLLSGESREPGGTEATQLPSSSPPVAGPLRRRLAAARPSPSLPC